MINNPIFGPGLQGKSGAGFFAEFLPNLVGLGFVVGVVIFFFVLLMGAISWIASGSDKQALEGARSKLTNGITGLVILLVVFALVAFIEDFFGINILTIDIGPLIIKNN